MYILKPPASSRGRGIRMMRRPSDVKPEKDLLIQRYIRDPHLIDGYKYDMRVYVAVTCVDPLRVYVYREGLVRLATERYSDADKARLYKLHPGDPQLETARFQPLNLSSEKLVSSLCFQNATCTTTTRT
jgi:hypothetical protein